MRPKGLNKAQFASLFDSGRRAKGDWCRVVSAPGCGRTGISTPKKLGCHAKRNRLKRRMREAVRISITLNPQFDALFIAHASAESASFVDLQSDAIATYAASLSLWDAASESS